MKSKFYEVYNLIMEEINQKLSEFDIIKNRCYRVLEELEKNGNDSFKIGSAQLAKDEKSLSQYKVICAGKDVIKLVKNNQKTGSGKYKIKSLSAITLNNVTSNPYYNAIFYVLHNQKLKSIENNIPFEIYTPASAGEKEQKEEKQIENFKNELEKFGDEGITIKDPNNDERGPFNNIKKTEGNKPKSDATIYNDDGKTNDKIYVSLKSSEGKPIKPGTFNQFGGKRDLGGDDDKILEKSKFINRCYSRIEALFDQLKITNYDFQALKTYLLNYNKENNTKFSPTFAFMVKDDDTDIEYLYKTKYGKNFGETDKSNPENVDILIDGEMEIKDETLKGTTHTEWNPSLYQNANNDNSEFSKNYKMVVAFAPQLSPGIFKKFRHVRFNIFPANSGRVKIYLDKTEELLNKFGV